MIDCNVEYCSTLWYYYCVRGEPQMLTYSWVMSVAITLVECVSPRPRYYVMQVSAETCDTLVDVSRYEME